MRDIFTDLYNKVLNFFNKADEKRETKDVACNRLKLVLMQDRTNLSPAIMDRMRRELIELLSKYMELDKELLDLNFEHEDEQMALMLSIPVVRAKTEEEIQAILDKEDAEKEQDEEEEETEDETDEEFDDDSDDDLDDEETSDEDDDGDEDDSEEEDDDEITSDSEKEEEKSDTKKSKTKKSDEDDSQEPTTTKAKKEKFFKKKEEETEDDE